MDSDIREKLEPITDPTKNPIFMRARKENKLTVITLGTGIPVPNVMRAGPSNAILYKKNCIIVDCARWATRQMISAKISFKQIKGVIFTHLHQDHINAWPTLWMDSLFCGRSEPWHIWGPVGTKKCIEAIRTFNASDIRDRI
ncbi:MAG: MBL fold metallo-hydrolase, partial [Candidatus Hodarchaeota archaeon]